MASEISHEAAVRSGAARRPVLAGIGIALGASLVISLLHFFQSRVFLDPTPMGIIGLAMQILFIGSVIMAVLLAMWSRPAALAASITMIVVHVVANTITVVWSLLGGMDGTYGLPDPGVGIFMALVNLGSTYWVTSLAGGFAGGWLLIALLERKQGTTTTSA